MDRNRTDVSGAFCPVSVHTLPSHIRCRVMSTPASFVEKIYVMSRISLELLFACGMYRHYSKPLVYHGLRWSSPLRHPQALSFADASAINSAVSRNNGTTQNTIFTSLLSLLIKSWDSPASNRCRTRDSPLPSHIVPPLTSPATRPLSRLEMRRFAATPKRCWRAEWDSNPLPSAVPTAAHPYVLPARIAVETDGGKAPLCKGSWLGVSRD